MLRSLFYFFFRCFSAKSTLSGYAIQRISRRNPYLGAIHKTRRRRRFQTWFNNGLSSMLFTFSIISFLLLLCFIPSQWINSTVPDFLTVIKFGEDYADASTLISDTLGAAATIVGLSFVVIGLLVETVKTQTKINYSSIFRLSYMYYGFSISFVGLLFLVFFNLMKFGISKYTLGNVAILSCFILFFITFSIGVIFYRFLKFLGPEIYAVIARYELVWALQQQLLDESIEKMKTQIYVSHFRYLKFRPHNGEFGASIPNWLSIQIHAQEYLYDIILPLLRIPVNRIRKRTGGGLYNTLPPSSILDTDFHLLTLENDQKASGIEMYLIDYSLIRRKKSVDKEFFALKSGLEERLLEASKKGEVRVVNETMSLINDLYQVYYQAGNS